MQLNELKPKHKAKERKIIGRGGKRGTYSGRGIKGQRSRSGRRLEPSIRILIKRYPKLRGYKFKSQLDSKPAIVSIRDIEKKFKTNEIVNPQTLLEKRLIRKIKGKVPKVKILGKGNLTKSLTIENCLFSKTAKEKINKFSAKIRE